MSKQNEIPSPAVLAARVNAATERERVKRVRQRRRLKRGARLGSHLDDSTMTALAKIAHPDISTERNTR